MKSYLAQGYGLSLPSSGMQERFCVKNKVNSQQQGGFQEGSLGLEVNLTEP